MSRDFDRVVVVRHGQTEWNREGRRQGQLDSPLTADGTAHAHELAHSLDAITIDIIASSPLGRAHATARIIAAELGRPVTVIEDLRELDHGSYAGLTNGEIDQHHPGELARRAADKYWWRFPHGESYADARVRAEHALERVAALGARAPLLVTHEMLGRMLLSILAEIEPKDALSLRLQHGTWMEVTPATRTVTTHSTQLGDTRGFA